MDQNRRQFAASLHTKLQRYRGALAAFFVLAAFGALSTLGYGGISASAVYGYGYGYGYEYQYGDANLIVVKHVVNDNGGGASASNFTMTINGVTAAGGNSFPGSEAGTNKTVTAPGSYTVTETGPAGYSSSFSAGCGGSIAIGQTKTCTVTNDDIPGHLIVIKHVVNDDNGTASASDFTMTIGGVTAQGGNSFPGAESPGTDKIVTPGSYGVTETGPAGYVTSFSAGCTGTIALNETKTCTVTNNDIAKPATPGFWKNHLDLTASFLPLSLGAYTVSTAAQAAAVFDAMNCSISKADAVSCLAGQLLATELNLAKGSPLCITPVVTKANDFLSGASVTYAGLTVTGITYTGPGGTYNLTDDQRTVALALKDALDRYNNKGKC